MGFKKKYIAIQISTENTDSSVNVNLSFGDITGPHYSRNYPEEEFDTEEEAITYAYRTNEYARWLIVPIIKFN